MKKLLPLLLILVLLGSGCTVPILNIEIPGIPNLFGGPTVVEYEHDIIIIRSLEAIPAEIDSGQSTRIVAYVENKGDITVKDINVKLYDYCEGLFYINNNLLASMCPNNAWADTGHSTCKITLLPGQIAPVAWILEQRGEVNLKTICPPDGVKVSAMYNYSTSSLTTISFIAREELERTLEQRTFKSTESYIVAGQGPIKPYLTVEDNQPIPVYTGGARTVLKLVISNKGSGQLATSSIQAAKVVITGLDKNGDMRPINPCNLKEGSSSGSAPAGVPVYNPALELKFIGKDTSPMLCNVDVSNLKVVRTGTRHIEVTVKYDYIFSKSVQVTVNPKIAT